MPESTVTDSNLALRRVFALYLNLPVTDPRVTELVAAWETLYPALVDSLQPGRYCDLVTKVVEGRVTGVQVTWQVRQSYPRRTG